MTYAQALAYLDSFIDYEKLSDYSKNKLFGLERIERLLDFLGRPQDKGRYIHIAGTKGKGSTCAFVAYILREAGYKVGLYTSPHLSDFRERIRILERSSAPASPEGQAFGAGQRPDFEGMISKRDLARLVEKIRRDAINRVSTPTFFEIYTALAFLYFKEKKADFVVLETGLGGRLDATNVAKPLVCVITPISLEHTAILGGALRDIAKEKAGIIKDAPVVITAPQEKEALEVIKQKCANAGARLLEIKRYKKRRLRLLGRHQLINAAVASKAVWALRFYGVKIGPAVVDKGLRRTIWPGRCEVISRHPLVVLDGAQNAASARALKQAVRESFRYKRLILVFGVSGDKDKKGISRWLGGLADEVILTKSQNPRAASPLELAGYFAGKKTHKTSNVKQARQKAYAVAKAGDLILVTGSLYIVGEFRDGAIRN